MPPPIPPAALAHWLAIQAALAVRGIHVDGSRLLIEMCAAMTVPDAVARLAVIVPIEDALRLRRSL